MPNIHNQLTGAELHIPFFAIQSAEPSDPREGDMWLDTTADPPTIKVYISSEWKEPVYTVNLSFTDNPAIHNTLIQGNLTIAQNEQYVTVGELSYDNAITVNGSIVVQEE